MLRCTRSINPLPPVPLSMKSALESPAPRVSVLVPLYKTQEIHLRQLIESVLAQTLREFECILYNDSPESGYLGQIVAEYGDARIRYVSGEKNLGISGARNRLIELAAAPYLAIIDHDDVMLPNRLELQTAYLDAHPGVGVVGCYVREIPHNRVVRYPEMDGDVRLALMGGCAVPHTGSMIRSAVLRESGIRYEDEFCPAEDYALWIRLLGYTEFHNIPQVLTQYRVHTKNVSCTQKARMKQSADAVRTLARELHPGLYLRSHALCKRVTYVRLFSLVPLFKIVHKCDHATVYLFDCIPVCTLKSKITWK